MLIRFKFIIRFRNMLVHTCCCIFIFMMLGFDQILKEFEFQLKLGLKMCLRK